MTGLTNEQASRTITLLTLKSTPKRAWIWAQQARTLTDSNPNSIMTKKPTSSMTIVTIRRAVSRSNADQRPSRPLVIYAQTQTHPDMIPRPLRHSFTTWICITTRITFFWTTRTSLIRVWCGWGRAARVRRRRKRRNLVRIGLDWECARRLIRRRPRSRPSSWSRWWSTRTRNR